MNSNALGEGLGDDLEAGGLGEEVPAANFYPTGGDDYFAGEMAPTPMNMDAPSNGKGSFNFGSFNQ